MIYHVKGSRRGYAVGEIIAPPDLTRTHLSNRSTFRSERLRVTLVLNLSM